MDMDAQTEEQHLQAVHRKRMAALAADKKRIFAMTPEKALDAILEHPANTALIHSLAEEDFLFLINDIGHFDALEIISLASARQWEYILDMGAWQRDRIRLESVAYWMKLLHQADAGRFVQWTMQEKYEILEYFLNKTSEIVIREHDEDPSDLADGFFTCDDVFYIRFSSDVFSDIEDEEDREEIEEFVYSMIRRIADEDHVAYQMLLLRAASVIPGESEEEAFRFRNVRLAEKGFLPFDEAVGVYAPLRPGDVRKDAGVKSQKAEMDFTVPVPLNHTFMLENGTLFEQALKSLDFEEALNDIQVQFASLCNRVIAADQNQVSSKEQLKSIVNRVRGYLEIGIHRLSGMDAPPESSLAASIIYNHPLEDIFRTGYALILELRNRALKWQKKSWFSTNKIALSFWGERLVGHIGGLMLKHPKFFDNYQTGQLYRDFGSLADIREAAKALNEAMTFDKLLSFMNIDTGGFPDQRFITFQEIMLTLWAKDRIGLPPGDRLRPIPLEKFRPFYKRLWDSGENSRRIKDSVKTDFLEWIAGMSGLSTYEISSRTSASLENIFRKIEEEFADVDVKDLDYRFVNLFLLGK
jgi:hypothetical protein